MYDKISVRYNTLYLIYLFFILIGLCSIPHQIETAIDYFIPFLFYLIGINLKTQIDEIMSESKALFMTVGYIIDEK